MEFCLCFDEGGFFWADVNGADKFEFHAVESESFNVLDAVESVSVRGAQRDSCGAKEEFGDLGHGCLW